MPAGALHSATSCSELHHDYSRYCSGNSKYPGMQPDGHIPIQQSAVCQLTALNTLQNVRPWSIVLDPHRILQLSQVMQLSTAQVA